MTLPASGPISLNNVNVELGLSGTTTISMNQATVRTLFAVPSGAISMSDGYGKSNQFAFTISSNQTDANLRTLALNAGWPGVSKVIATLGSGVQISSTSTAIPALTINGSFPNGIEFINNGVIVGRGGAGGGGAIDPSGTFATAFAGSGGAGGTGLSVSVAVTINNASGTISGGGGGGGGGGLKSANDPPENAPGGGGGGGNGFGTGGVINPPFPFGSPVAGSAGGQLGGGAGGTGSPGTGPNGEGGTGGSFAGSGSTGGPGEYPAGAPGGAGGAAISGNSNITYISTGTRYGSIS
jgi:hypothetical protein